MSPYRRWRRNTITAVTETNRGRCSNSTGTQRKYPIPIEGGAGERDINEDGHGFLRHSPMAHSELHWRNDRLLGN